ncbi:hypothetical protein OURE66S_03537 [Oligella ureolytica]
MSSELKNALEMFIFLALELSILFIGISFIINYLQERFPVLQNVSLLSSGKKEVIALQLPLELLLLFVAVLQYRC